ncbi:MAG: ferrous iron transport protein B [Chloroflexi bacterium]|nr:ferrous iron transport protein B [Chloroflexota bacterium]
MGCHSQHGDIRAPSRSGGLGLLNRRSSTISVAIAGQPNVGKSTVFNALTGLRQHVGNWPGKTIERRTGTLERNGLVLELVDLPGTYSLSASSAEELVARDYILEARPDAIVLVTDATALERNLYLLAELLALPSPVVLALNMLDVAANHGLQIDASRLEAELGLPVVPMIATRGDGIERLVETVAQVVDGRATVAPRRPLLTLPHAEAVQAIETSLNGSVPAPYSTGWVALKLLEGDRDLTDRAPGWLTTAAWDDIQTRLGQHPGAMLDIAGARYAWIEEVARAATVQPATAAASLTERVDRVATHPFLGLAMLLGMLSLVYWLTFTLAAPLQEWLEVTVVDGLSGWIRDDMGLQPAWLASFLIDGVLGGAGTVLTFLPVLVVFFAALGVLEDTGYLARVAYVMDRCMHAMGLHGKSVLPLVLGFGCNVPAIMGTRVLESRSSRLLTIVLAPFVPCAARFAVLAFLVPAFFSDAAPLVAAGLVALNLVVLSVLGVVLHRLLFRGEQLALIMELPLYHLPNARTIGLFVWNNVREFLGKAAGPIVVLSIAVWALSSFPGSEVEESVLGMFGQAVEPFGQLMGMDWRMIVALLASFPAKENAIAVLGVLYGAGEEGVGLAEQMAEQVSVAGAVAYLAMQMLFIPCMATVTMIYRESQSVRWTLFSLGLSLSISLLAGLLLYQGLSLFGLGG